eukprot:1339369-Amorphochlora_amoeboformis.AAC.2
MPVPRPLRFALGSQYPQEHGLQSNEKILQTFPPYEAYIRAREGDYLTDVEVCKPGDLGKVAITIVPRALGVQTVLIAW